MTSSNPSGIAKTHLAALGDGRNVAERFSQLHGLAVQEFVRTTPGDGPPKRAVVVLASHSYNTYIAALDLVVRGLFDVAAYLMRGLFDVPCLILVTGHDPESAERFWSNSDELKASDARKWVQSNHADADVLLQEVDELYRFMNEFSHTGQHHGKSLLDVKSGGITPTFGGRLDDRRALIDVAIIGKLEMLTLTALSEFGAASDAQWWAEFGSAVKLYTDWFKEVRARVTRQ